MIGITCVNAQFDILQYEYTCIRRNDSTKPGMLQIIGDIKDSLTAFQKRVLTESGQSIASLLNTSINKAQSDIDCLSKPQPEVTLTK